MIFIVAAPDAMWRTRSTRRLRLLNIWKPAHCVSSEMAGASVNGARSGSRCANELAFKMDNGSPRSNSLIVSRVLASVRAWA